MKKFLYLRITAIIAIMHVTAIMIYIISGWIGHFNYRNWYWLVLNEGLLALFLCQSFLVLFIFRNYYPDNQITKTYKICYHLSATFALIFNIFFILAVIFEVTNGKPITVVPILVISFMTITTMVQFVGGWRMIKTIQRNALLQLESSFT
jgi:hypothetical protein